MCLWANKRGCICVFFHSRPNIPKPGKENCPSLMPNYLTGKLKTKRIDIKAVLGHVGLKFLWGKIDKGKYVSAWEKLDWSSTKKSKYLLGNIFIGWCVMLESLHSECLYPKADLVHECASCCQWVTCRICHSVTVLGKGANPVYPGQDYCNDSI